MRWNSMQPLLPPWSSRVCSLFITKKGEFWVGYAYYWGNHFPEEERYRRVLLAILKTLYQYYHAYRFDTHFPDNENLTPLPLYIFHYSTDNGACSFLLFVHSDPQGLLVYFSCASHRHVFGHDKSVWYPPFLDYAL